jgi:hypothetical protein
MDQNIMFRCHTNTYGQLEKVNQIIIWGYKVYSIRWYLRWIKARLGLIVLEWNWSGMKGIDIKMN